MWRDLLSTLEDDYVEAVASGKGLKQLESEYVGDLVEIAEGFVPDCEVEAYIVAVRSLKVSRGLVDIAVGRIREGRVVD